MELWIAYLIFYSVFTLFSLWYDYCIVLVQDISTKKHRKYPARVSIIIPTYKEEKAIIARTIREACKINAEVIVIDDGSGSDEVEFLKSLPYKFTLYHYEKNMGKRYAQSIGFLNAKSEIVITLDSDTLITQESVDNILKPFHNKRIAAVTGNAKVANKNKNLLTRMIAARYWNAFNFERYRQSFFGLVTCCTGVFSAYRKDIVIPLIKAYNNQVFMGKKQTWGDDRALTTMLLRNHEVVYCKDALAYTHVPEKFGKFVKQQIRWKKSFIRESYLSLSFMFKRSGILSYDVLYTSLMPYLSLLVRISMILFIIVHPPLILWFIGVIVLMAFLRSYYMFMEEGMDAVNNISYAFVHELVIYWLYFYALLTLNDTRWGTR